jgi:hypothetical protein
MMLGVNLKPRGSALMARRNISASNFFTLCFYAYYFLVPDFCTHIFFNLSKLKPRVRRGSIVGAEIAAITQHPP